MVERQTRVPRLSDLVRSELDSEVRYRGEEYARDGRVLIFDHKPGHVQAQVKGSSDYFVLLSVNPDLRKLNCACTCPYYRDRGPCKHLWATIIVAEESGYLSSDGFFGEAGHAPGNGLWPMPDFEEEDDDDDLEGFFEPDFGEDEEDDDASMVPFPRPVDGWRNVMASLQQITVRQDDAGTADSRELRYLLDIEGTLHSRGGIEIEVYSRRPRKNTEGWTMCKPLKLTAADIGGLADADDRRIAAMLTGATLGGQGYYRYAYQSGNSRFTVSAPLAEYLLPVLAGTGRFGWSAGMAPDRDWHTLVLDGGAPWQFGVEVVKDGEQQGYEVTGVLTRDSERIELAAPVVLLASGWVITESTVARLDHAGAFPWIVALRERGKLQITGSEIGDWVGELLKCRVRPRVTLPEELQWEERSVVPAPAIRIYRPEGGPGRGLLGAAVSFTYDEIVFRQSDSQRGVYDPDTRCLLVRDLAAESVLLARLDELGFRRARYAYTYAYPDEVDLEIHSREFARAVHALVTEGWDVEAQGVKCRSAGSVGISVRSSGIDWFEVDGAVEFDGASAPLPQVLAALRRGTGMVHLDDGTMGVLPEDWLKRYSILAEAGVEEEDHIRFARCQAVLLDAMLAAEPNVTCDEVFGKAREEIRSFSSIAPEPAPKGFRGSLRAYQRDGLGWLKFIERFGFGGCLADDMGLGKTVQALAMLESERQKKGGTSLVVVPKSIVVNWLSEAERFAPRLKALNHTGTARTRSAESFSGVDMVVTTYGTMRRDIVWLKDVEFNWLVLDEAQAIKNSATSTAKAARLLKGRQRLAMSGTPIENHLGELWSLFEFLNPGMLGNSSVFARISNCSDPEEDDCLRDLLSRALRPFILRRTKEQVATDLPDKVEETIVCEMPASQRRVYDELREYYRRGLMAKVEAEGLGGSKIMVLEALLRLRQAACHPGLLDPGKRRQSSAKLDLLLEQIEDVIGEGHKMLVFSQFTSMLAIVKTRLDSRDICYEYLDGKTRERARRVDRFQTDPDCRLFLISLKAGGLGLNLTAADYVVLLDPWWNPAVEAQAIDRAHRIGQAKKVFAYRLVAKDTVEERILELQKTKKQLADSIITVDNSLIRDLKREDLDLLLS